MAAARRRCSRSPRRCSSCRRTRYLGVRSCSSTSTSSAGATRGPAGRHHRHGRGRRRGAGADVVWIETPTNPTLDVADLPAIAAAAAAAGATTVVDSTFATPICAAAARRRGDGRRPQRHEVHRRSQRPDDRACVTADDDVHERLRPSRARQGRDTRRAGGLPRAPRRAHAAVADGARAGQRRGRSSTACARTRPSRTSAIRAAVRWSRSWCAAARAAADAVCAGGRAARDRRRASAASRRRSNGARSTPATPTSRRDWSA